MESIVIGLLTRPVETYQQLKGKHYVWWATLLLVFSHWVWLLPDSIFALPTNIPISLVVVAFFGIVFTLLVALFLHGGAQLLGGKGHFSGTYQAFAFSYLPLIFNAPLELLEYMGISSRLFTWIELALIVWSIGLAVIGLREIHYLTTAKALFLLAIPAIALALLILLGFFSLFFGATL